MAISDWTRVDSRDVARPGMSPSDILKEMMSGSVLRSDPSVSEYHPSSPVESPKTKAEREWREYRDGLDRRKMKADKERLKALEQKRDEFPEAGSW